MENRFKKIREEYSEERKDKNPKAKIYSVDEMCNEFQKMGFNISTSRIKKVESNTPGAKIDSEMLLAYKKKFNVSADWLIDNTIETKQLTGDIASASKITGLSDNAIDTLIKLKSGKYYNQHKFDYALHTLNLILSSYENANFFDLIYHFLFGNYDTMGHFDEMGRIVYDGSEVFISDKYNANQMSINSDIVNKAVLQLITDQLECWKKSLDTKKDNYGKILPPKEKLLQKVKERYSNIKELIQWHKDMKNNYEEIKSQKSIDFERLFHVSKSIINLEIALENTYREIKNLNYPLKELYNAEYHEIEIDDYLERM